MGLPTPPVESPFIVGEPVVTPEGVPAIVDNHMFEYVQVFIAAGNKLELWPEDELLAANPR